MNNSTSLMSNPAKGGAAHWFVLLLLCLALIYVALYFAGVLK